MIDFSSNKLDLMGTSYKIIKGFLFMEKQIQQLIHSYPSVLEKLLAHEISSRIPVDISKKQFSLALLYPPNSAVTRFESKSNVYYLPIVC